MNILDNVLYEEIMKKEAELRILKETLSAMPKGCIFVRKTPSGNYVYRKWREDDKVLSEYLGKLGSSKTLTRIKEMNEYKLLEAKIKKEANEIKELKKAYRLILLKTKLKLLSIITLFLVGYGVYQSPVGQAGIHFVQQTYNLFVEKAHFVLDQVIIEPAQADRKTSQQALVQSLNLKQGKRCIQ